MTKIVFWEPCESPHKSHFFAALSKEIPQIKIICCYDAEMLSSRSALGWEDKKPEGVINFTSPDYETICSLISGEIETTLHVFSGIRWVRTINTAISLAKKNDAKYCIWHEPREIEGWKGKLRLVHSWLTEKYHRKNSLAVLAIGRNGPRWFKWAGYNSCKIIPFAYFVDPPSVLFLSTDTRNDRRKIRVGYLGRLVKMKGIYDIVDALTFIESDVDLSFAGDGIERERLEDYCASKGVNSKFYGVLKISEIGGFLSNVDVLVVPSTSNDGWAVVVSESLMAGVPVVCTELVGASVLLEDDSFGRIVSVNNPRQISNAIVDLRDSGAFTTHSKIHRSRRAISILSAEAGANYFSGIISWLEGKSEKPSEFYRHRG
ncbi:MAG: glycosyltransferase [Dehalococcoidales bacterium]